MVGQIPRHRNTDIRGETARELHAWMSMHMLMNELALSDDKRCEARRMRLVDRDDPHFRQFSKSRVDRRNGIQESSKVALDSKNSSKKCIALADCDEFLSFGLCFYDEGDAACYSPSRFVILKPMDIERWKCAAAFSKKPYFRELGRIIPGLTKDTYRFGHRCSKDEHILDSPYGSFLSVQSPWRFAVVLIVGFGPAAIVVFVISKICDAVELELEAMQELRDTFVSRACCFGRVCLPCERGRTHLTLRPGILCDSENPSRGGMLYCALDFRAGCIRGIILVSVFLAYHVSFADTKNVLLFTFGCIRVA